MFDPSITTFILRQGAYFRDSLFGWPHMENKFMGEVIWIEFSGSFLILQSEDIKKSLEEILLLNVLAFHVVIFQDFEYIGWRYFLIFSPLLSLLSSPLFPVFSSTPTFYFLSPSFLPFLSLGVYLFCISNAIKCII